MAIAHFLQNTYTGRLGDTIGTSWKGKKVWRTAAVNVKDAKSEKQIRVRNAFSVVSAVSSGINDVWLKKYFGSVKKMTPYNMVLKNNKAFIATDPLDPLKISLPQNYLGATTAPSTAPSLSGQTISLEMPAASALSQGTPTEYLVACLQLTTTTDAQNNERLTGVCSAVVVSASSAAVSVTVNLPLPVSSGDKIYVYTQAGDGTRVNFSSSAVVTAS